MVHSRILSARVASLLAGALCSCMGGGGSGSSTASGSFQLVSTGVVTGSVVPINRALEFRFDKEIDPASVHFGSITIQGLPPASVGAPVPGPVSGSFFVKQGARDTVLFQPSCPTNAQLDNGGFLPGNLFGAVVYQVTVGGLSGPTNSVVRAVDGSRLGKSYSFQFRTPTPPESPLLDPAPSGPPRVTALEGLPAALPLNLWSEPLPPILVELDQPVLAGSIDKDSVRLEFDHPAGGVSRIPVTVSLAANCTEENRARLLVSPAGVLPPGLSVRFYLSRLVTGFGAGDSPATDELFHTAIVDAAAIPSQIDAIGEFFRDERLRDADPPLLDPPAIWGNSMLSSGPLHPGAVNDIDIEIGPGSTNSNGGSFVFSTDTGVLKDTSGFSHTFQNGVIEVRSFRVKSPVGAGSSVLFGLGENPLVIRASEIVVESGAFIVVDGQDALPVAGLNVPNLPQPGGAGVCGGGNGGAASPNTTNSDARGGDGEGPYHAPNDGGKGGDSGYSSVGYLNDVGGGGGGGNFGLFEQDSSNQWVVFCYSTTLCSPAGCPMPLPTAGTGCTNPNCNGVFQNPSSWGESGGSGSQCTNQTSPPGLVCDLGGSNGKICQRSAVTGLCLARGGVPGPAVFSDADPSNNFLGRKAEFAANRAVIQKGELTKPLPGQGGGAGGDTVVSTVFPSGSSNFLNTDLKGGAGGGGSGALILQALRVLDIRGTLRAKGGDGSEGEQQSGGGCSSAAGGGGSGGAIVLECAGKTIFGKAAKVISQGGNRGFGCYTVPGQPPSGGGSYCRTNASAGRGGAGGKGPVMLAVPFDDDPTHAVSCGGLSRPAIRAGALYVEDAAGALQPVNCERASLLAGVSDPDLQVVLPSFGARSAAMSQWLYLGWSDLVSTPQPGFAGLDPLGYLDSTYTEIFASGSPAAAQVLAPDRVEIDSASLADSIRSAPLVLLGDGFQPGAAGATLAISGVTVSGNKVNLSIDLATGAVSSIGSWKILRRYTQPLVNGAASSFPANVTARILFEGADEQGAGTGLPNPSTISGPTANIASLAGKKLLRFQVTLDRNASQALPQPDLPEIGLRLLKIPYSF